MEKMKDAMKKVAEANKEGITVAGGKKYTQVVTRIEIFREFFGEEYGIETDVKLGQNGVLVSAKIIKDGYTYGSGHAFCANFVKEKAVEKTETTAIGRALASFGLAGGEYCSQDEIDSYEDRYNKEEIKPVEVDEFNLILNSIKDAKTNDELTSAKENAKAAWRRMDINQQTEIIEQINISDKVMLENNMEAA